MIPFNIRYAGPLGDLFENLPMCFFDMYNLDKEHYFAPRSRYQSLRTNLLFRCLLEIPSARMFLMPNFRLGWNEKSYGLKHYHRRKYFRSCKILWKGTISRGTV